MSGCCNGLASPLRESSAPRSPELQSYRVGGTGRLASSARWGAPATCRGAPEQTCSVLLNVDESQQPALRCGTTWNFLLCLKSINSLLTRELAPVHQTCQNRLSLPFFPRLDFSPSWLDLTKGCDFENATLSASLGGEHLRGWKHMQARWALEASIQRSYGDITTGTFTECLLCAVAALWTIHTLCHLSLTTCLWGEE